MATTTSRKVVRAYDRYRDNAALIQAARDLGHISGASRTLDWTYGKGTWWKRWRPRELTTNDLDTSTDAEHHHDFTDRLSLPKEWHRHFDVTCYDPPYGLRGTVNATNGGYGLGQYMSVESRHLMMRTGLQTAIATTRAGGTVLAKCQDQVCSGRMYWQTPMLQNAALIMGAELIERLDMEGGRAQPPRLRWGCGACGKDNCGPSHHCRYFDAYEAKMGATPLYQHPSPQEHAYFRPSTLLIFRATHENLGRHL